MTCGATVPIRRMGDAWGVASDDAAYVTGQCLVVDGGLTATSPGA